MVPVAVPAILVRPLGNDGHQSPMNEKATTTGAAFVSQRVVRTRPPVMTAPDAWLTPGRPHILLQYYGSEVACPAKSPGRTTLRRQLLTGQFLEALAILGIY